MLLKYNFNNIKKPSLVKCVNLILKVLWSVLAHIQQFTGRTKRRLEVIK